MKRIVVTGAFALAMVLGVNAAHAGGASGGPITTPTNPCDSDPDADGCSGNGDPTDPGAGGGTTPSTPGGGTTPPTPQAPNPIPYFYGSGALVFKLDSLPTGGSGTQAFYQPYQDNSAYGVMDNLSTQGVLHETVGGTTVSFSTDTFHAGGTEPMTRIRVENDTSNFGGAPPSCCLVPTGVQVGIEATTLSSAAPGAVYVNFTDTLSYFSINLYRLYSGPDPLAPFSVTSTVTAYSGLDGTGMVLGTATGSVVGGSNFGYSIIELANLAGARSFTLQGGSGLANYDAITATLGAPAATGAVPETATWAMFIGGFGFVGGALRRQRKASVRFA